MARKLRKIKVTSTGNPFRKPSWEEFKGVDIINVDKVAVRREVSQGSRYYNYKHKSKDGKKWFVEYLKKEKVDRDKIKHVKLVLDWRVGITYGALAKMLMDGCPPLEEYTVALEKRLEDCLKLKVEKAKQDEVKFLAPVISIQERMKENLYVFLGEHVEGEIDNFFENKLKSNFKMSNALHVKEITGKAAGMIPPLYAKEIQEIIALLNPPKDPDEVYEQLVEGYPYKKAELKKILAFYTMIVEDAEHHANAKKANRKIRIKKAPSLEKVVVKLKYAITNEKYKLVSIDPKKIVGAQELWVFNAKTRKLGKYVAGNGFNTSELGIKGTSIIGFDEKNSIQKTIRKPEVTLKEFQKAGKVALRKFLEDIKATDIKLTGRINKEIVLLKVN